MLFHNLSISHQILVFPIINIFTISILSLLQNQNLLNCIVQILVKLTWYHI